jgi:hypothetical protein
MLSYSAWWWIYWKIKTLATVFLMNQLCWLKYALIWFLYITHNGMTQMEISVCPLFLTVVTAYPGNVKELYIICGPQTELPLSSKTTHLASIITTLFKTCVAWLMYSPYSLWIFYSLCKHLVFTDRSIFLLIFRNIQSRRAVKCFFFFLKPFQFFISFQSSHRD